MGLFYEFMNVLLVSHLVVSVSAVNSRTHSTCPEFSTSMAVDLFLPFTDYLIIADGSTYLKVVAAGAIIGIEGGNIAQVQKKVNARIKMSKTNDFYPGNLYCCF